MNAAQALRLVHAAVPARGLRRDRARRAPPARPRRRLPRHRRAGAVVRVGDRHAVELNAQDHEHQQVVAVAWDYANSAGVDAQLSLLVDPLSVFMILVVSGVSTLIHAVLDQLPGLRRGLRALLRVPELLRLLDAAARPGGQLPRADRRLGVRRRRLLPADQLLVPAHDRHARGHQGVRHQRPRRRRPRARHVLHLQARRHARLPRHLRGRPRGASSRATATSPRAASCCSSARSRSPRRSRCTRGCPTRWRARRPSAP